MATQHKAKSTMAPIKGLDFSRPEINLPDEFMGDCMNVLIEDFYVAKRKGYLPLITGDTSAITTTAVMAGMEYTDASGNEYLVFISTDKAFRYNVGAPDAWAEITGLSFTGDTDDIVIFANVGGTNSDNLYITNGKDPLQVWTGSGSWASLGIDNFTTLTAKSMIGYRGHLVLGDVTEDGTHYPYRIRQSKVGDPTVWDEAANESANFQNLVDDTNNSKVQGFEPLSNVLVCYKEGAIYNVSYEGSRGWFVPRMQVSDYGAISRRAWAPVLDGDVHLILSKANLHLYDGFELKQPAIGDRIKKNLFDNLNWEYRHTAFVVANPERYEAYIAIPKGSATTPDRVYVWNWLANSFTIVEFADNVTSMIYTDTFFDSRKLLLGVVQNVMEMFSGNTDNGTKVDGWFRTKLSNYGDDTTKSVQHVEIDADGNLPLIQVGKLNNLVSDIIYGTGTRASAIEKSSPKVSVGEEAAIYNTIKISDNTNSDPFRIAFIRQHISGARGKH